MIGVLILDTTEEEHPPKGLMTLISLAWLICYLMFQITVPWGGGGETSFEYRIDVQYKSIRARLKTLCEISHDHLKLYLQSIW